MSIFWKFIIGALAVVTTGNIVGAIIVIFILFAAEVFTTARNNSHYENQDHE